MLLNFENKTDAAEFVSDLLKAFPNAYVSTTITEQGKYVVCCASTATDLSSEEQERLRASIFSETQVAT